jgi:hypothetical protein
MKRDIDKNALAYMVGVAFGDGNLSNPNGRAIRLRISCDIKYPNLIKKISESLSVLFPKNKVSVVRRKCNCADISCYSNKMEEYLGWSASLGPKHKQNLSVPNWIKVRKKYTVLCLRGLFETDGSVYKDRNYTMVNFVTIIPGLANDVVGMIKSLGFIPNIQTYLQKSGTTKYTIRISRNASGFIKVVGIDKS